MKKERIVLWKEAEYRCPTPGTFVPFLTAYCHDEPEFPQNSDRPAILVVPGGAYVMVASGEAEIVALHFVRQGFNAYVLTYTCALFEGKPVRLQPLKDLARAVQIIRSTENGKLAVCGFSAGGHLAGSLGVHWNDPEICPPGAQAGSLRPNAEILCYPVVTAGEYAHRDSFVSLFGKEAGEKELFYASLEKHVTGETPPTFLWHTVTDAEVPVENSLIYASALKTAGVTFELHLFSKGPHGCSLADKDWAEGKYGELYTMEQFFSSMQYHIDRQIPLPDGQPLPSPGTDFRRMFDGMPKDYLKAEAIPEVAVWPQLAVNWLKSIGFFVRS